MVIDIAYTSEICPVLQTLFFLGIEWQSLFMAVFGMVTVANTDDYQKANFVIGDLKFKPIKQGIYRSIGSCGKRGGVYSWFGNAS